MSRPVKITLWSLAGILVIITAAIAVVVNIVFSKEKLTPIVRQQLPNYISADTQLDDVELTFFSSFPNFSLQLNNLSVVNPKEGAANDTLLNVKELQAIIDVMSYLKQDKVDIKAFLMNDGYVNLFIAADSTTNFDIFVTSDKEENTSTMTLNEVNLKDVKLHNVNLCLTDQTTAINLGIEGFNANIQGETRLLDLGTKIRLDSYAQAFSYADSLSRFFMEGLQIPACELEMQDTLHLSLRFTTAFEKMGFSLLGQEAFEMNTGALHMQDVNIQIADKELTDASMKVILDSLSFSLTGKDPLDLHVTDLKLNLPAASLNGGIRAQFDAKATTATLNTKADGLLLNKLPVSLSGRVEVSENQDQLTLSEGLIQAGQESISLNAELQRLDSLTNQVNASFNLAPTTIDRLFSLVPTSYRKQLNGVNVHGNLNQLEGNACVTLETGKPVELENFDINTSVLNLKYNDAQAMSAVAKAISFESHYPVENQRMSAAKREQQIKRQKATNTKRRSRQALEASFMQAKLTGDQIHFEMHDSMNVVADLPHATFNGTFSDEILQDSQSLPFIAADFSFTQLNAIADTIKLTTHDLTGSLTMADGMRGMKKYYEASFDSRDADIQMGKSMSIITGPLVIEASSVYDHEQKDLLLRYNPLLNVTLADGNIRMSEVPYPFVIPTIDFDFNLGKFLIRDSQLRYGGSDFRLTGEVKNLREYLKKESDLLANLHLRSKQTDVYQLMDLADQFVGPADSTITTAPSDAEAYINATLLDHQNAETLNADANGADPFMVPQAIDMTLTTDIDKTIVGENEFNNLGGKLFIKDGNLVLEEMGFSSKAAKMQLTALYRTPRKNNLFVGANFHLLDINVEDLIRMIPEIDTIVPMLRSFEGKAEFHLAAETNLFGNYDVKMSTLKATAAIEGKDLVLLDGETFSTISKYLLFNKQTRNHIDTLSVEMAVNRKKMTLYPMLIGMDKYQAVISGSHDLTDNMPFNYHISVTDCPVVGGHIGLDINGDLDKPEEFDFKVVGCKYASLYKPERRNITQNQVLELKSLISDALKRTVKEQ